MNYCIQYKWKVSKHGLDITKISTIFRLQMSLQKYDVFKYSLFGSNKIKFEILRTPGGQHTFHLQQFRSAQAPVHLT